MAVAGPGPEFDRRSDPTAERFRRPRRLSREKSTRELLGDLARQTSTLAHREVELAKVDVRDKARAAGAGAGVLGVAAAWGLVGLACAAGAAVAALALVWPVWAAALVVSATCLVLAGILSIVGFLGIKRASGPVAAEAIQSTKEEAAWLRQARSATR